MSLFFIYSLSVLMKSKIHNENKITNIGYPMSDLHGP